MWRLWLRNDQLTNISWSFLSRLSKHPISISTGCPYTRDQTISKITGKKGFVKNAPSNGNFKEFFFCLWHLGWSLWRSLLFLINMPLSRPLPPTIHAFPSSPHKTKAGSWKRSEVGKCIQWHRPDDSILRRPCNICFQPLSEGWDTVLGLLSHVLSTQGPQFMVALSKATGAETLASQSREGWAMRGVFT